MGFILAYFPHTIMVYCVQALIKKGAGIDRISGALDLQRLPAWVDRQE